MLLTDAGWLLDVFSSTDQAGETRGAYLKVEFGDFDDEFGQRFVQNEPDATITPNECQISQYLKGKDTKHDWGMMMVRSRINSR